jgi:hypothetical protein
LFLALLLGACQVPPRPVTAGAWPGPSSGSPSVPAPDPAGKLPTNGELAADLTRFKGLAAQEVMAALGDPSYRRREAPAEIWQYFGAGCVLDLFLYEDSGAQRVAHVELRSRALGQGAQSSCLSQLLEGKRGQQSS